MTAVNCVQAKHHSLQTVSIKYLRKNEMVRVMDRQVQT